MHKEYIKITNAMSGRSRYYTTAQASFIFYIPIYIYLL